MRNAGVLAAIGVALAASLAGCSAAGGCSGEHQSPAYVTINATAWTEQHPGQSLKACLDDACSTVLQKETLKASSIEPQNHRYSITVTGDDLNVSMTRRVPTVGEKTGCGLTGRQAATITISASGTGTLYAGN